MNNWVLVFPPTLPSLCTDWTRNNTDPLFCRAAMVQKHGSMAWIDPSLAHPTPTKTNKQKNFASITWSRKAHIHKNPGPTISLHCSAAKIWIHGMDPQRSSFSPTHSTYCKSPRMQRLISWCIHGTIKIQDQLLCGTTVVQKHGSLVWILLFFSPTPFKSAGIWNVMSLCTDWTIKLPDPLQWHKNMYGMDLLWISIESQLCLVFKWWFTSMCRCQLQKSWLQPLVVLCHCAKLCLWVIKIHGQGLKFAVSCAFELFCAKKKKNQEDP